MPHVMCDYPRAPQYGIVTRIESRNRTAFLTHRKCSAYFHSLRIFSSSFSIALTPSFSRV